MEELKNEKENQNVTKIDRKNLEIERESLIFKNFANPGKQSETGKISETIKDIKKWNIISISIIGLSVIFIILWIEPQHQRGIYYELNDLNNVFFLPFPRMFNCGNYIILEYMAAKNQYLRKTDIRINPISGVYRNPRTRKI